MNDLDHHRLVLAASSAAPRCSGWNRQPCGARATLHLVGTARQLCDPGAARLVATAATLDAGVPPLRPLEEVPYA